MPPLLRQKMRYGYYLREYAESLGSASDHIVAVELGDVVYADTLGASGLALVKVGAVAEAEGIHLAHHGKNALVLLGVALGQQIKVSSLGRGEEHGSAVFAAGHASTTTNAGSGIKSGVCRFLAYGHIVGVGGSTGAHVHKAAGGDDVVQRGAVYHQVAQQREGRGTEGLDPDGVAILKLAHVQLAGCYLFAAMGHTVDGEGAHTANAFAAVVVKVDGLFTLVYELLVNDVEHLQEGGFIGDVLRLVGFDAALRVGRSLAPNLERKIEICHNCM